MGKFLKASHAITTNVLLQYYASSEAPVKIILKCVACLAVGIGMPWAFMQGVSSIIHYFLEMHQCCIKAQLHMLCNI